MFAIYGLIGLTLILLSFILNIFNLIPWKIISVDPIFVIGYFLLFDALDFKLNKTSILHKIKNKHIILFYLVIIGILIGLFTDFYGIYIGDLWKWYYLGYPLWLQILAYAGGLIFGYGLPILMYYSAYRVFLSIIKKEIKFNKKTLSKKLEKKIFSKLGLLSVALIFLSIILMTFAFKFRDFTIFAFSSLGLFFLLEYIEYTRHERSFLKDLFEGKWVAILSVIITAILTGFIWEFLNTLRPAWEYANFPFMYLTIAGVPLIILIIWIPFIIIYLSFYRVIFKGRDEVW